MYFRKNIAHSFGHFILYLATRERDKINDLLSLEQTNRSNFVK